MQAQSQDVTRRQYKEYQSTTINSTCYQSKPIQKNKTQIKLLQFQSNSWKMDNRIKADLLQATYFRIKIISMQHESHVNVYL